MIFDNITDARNHFRKYKIFFEDVEEYSGSFKFGDWYLIQHIKRINEDNFISCPILGIAVGYDVYDMTLVLKLIEQPRAWMLNNKIITIPEYNFSTHIYFETEIQEFIIWDDNILELGCWKNKPTFKELKEALLKQK